LRIFLEFEVRRVGCRQCGKVKRERLEFLANNPLYTKRFAFYVGRRCRSSPIRDVAQELKLDWHTVKELDKQYMRAQLAKAGTPAPTVIGIDEISVRKGHEYRIVVSDLIRGRPIWFGGDDRSEASMAQFYQWLGKKRGRIRLAVMDMWKPFRNAAYAPQAAILFDKLNQRASGLRLARHTVNCALHGHADLHGLVRFLGIQCWCGVVAVNLEASRVSECQRSFFHRYFRFPLQIM